MNRSWFSWVGVILLCAFPCCVGAADEFRAPSKPGPGVFFVATNGNDHWSGALPAPNRSKDDGPCASLPAALNAARLFKEKSSAPAHAAIFMRGGLYCLEQPVVLKPEDSGLLLAAYPGEQPQLSGGRHLSGWKAVTLGSQKLWAVQLPDVRSGKWLFHELWVNGTRAVHARHPNHGYFKIAEVPDKAAEWTQGQARFRFGEGDIKAWPSVTNAEVMVMCRWVDSHLPVLAVDEKDRMISFGKRAVFELAPGDPFFIEGALELLDEPGEWCLDPASGTLYYAPRQGEKLERVEAVAPILPQVLRLEGRPDAAQFVERVIFRDLTFSHTEWYFPRGFTEGKAQPNIWPPPKAEVGGFGQAAVGVPGAVWGEGVRECLFEGCSFSNLGTYGLELARGCQRNAILACEFSHLGAGGIKLGETRIRDRADEQSRANTIEGCRIHDGGLLFASAIGIWLGQTPDNLISHNLIHDFYYTGISIGWTWGYGPSLATNNTVVFNHVHHIGVRSDGDGPILSDMGGIYTLGKQSGTSIRNNLWHDIAGLRYGGWGIYFDEGSTGITAESNVVYRTTHGGFHQHYGETNIVRNNIIAFARDHQIQRTRPEPHRSFSFETNIVYFSSGKLLDGNWSDDNFKLDWNVYFDTRTAAKPPQADHASHSAAASQDAASPGSSSFPLGPMSLTKWREHGHDRNSLLTDPLFFAPNQNDFRLRPGSPALKLGFQPIDLTEVGPVPGTRK